MRKKNVVLADVWRENLGYAESAAGLMALERAGIRTLAAAARRTEVGLLKLPGFGRSSLGKLQRILAAHSRSLRGQEGFLRNPRFKRLVLRKPTQRSWVRMMRRVSPE